MPLPLISPFPPRLSLINNQGQLLYPDLYRHLLSVWFSLTFSSSSVNFCEVPPFLSAFAHVPFTQPSFRLRLSAP
jgi:hypothetical protein